MSTQSDAESFARALQAAPGSLDDYTFALAGFPFHGKLRRGNKGVILGADLRVHFGEAVTGNRFSFVANERSIASESSCGSIVRSKRVTSNSIARSTSKPTFPMKRF